MANTGIIHLSSQKGGTPYCRKMNAHMVTTEEDAKRWPRICVKCEAVRLKYEAKRARA